MSIDFFCRVGCLGKLCPWVCPTWLVIAIWLLRTRAEAQDWRTGWREKGRWDGGPCLALGWARLPSSQASCLSWPSVLGFPSGLWSPSTLIVNCVTWSRVSPLPSVLCDLWQELTAVYGFFPLSHPPFFFSRYNYQLQLSLLKWLKYLYPIPC